MGYYLKTPDPLTTAILSGGPDLGFLGLAKQVAAHATDFQAAAGQIFSLAILEACGGVMPTDEQIDRWMTTVLLSDGTYVLAWQVPEGGDWRDYEIARVTPNQ